EHGSQNFDTGAPALARAINRDYIDARITAMIHWNAVDATYPSLPDPGDSLMQANSPWSGAYHVGKQLWTVAHTTQFTQPGWQYLDNFESYPANSLAKYFADDAGGFDTQPCVSGHTGMCYKQAVTTAPITWPLGSDSPPITVVGDPSWSNYQVKVDALLQQSGNVDVIGRSFGVSQFGPGGSQGYHFRINSAGTWSLFKEDGNQNDTTLASGSRTIGTNTWHTLTLNLNSTNIQASIDGTQVASVTDGTYHSGQVGLLVSKWRNAMFDNFAVNPPGGPGGPSITTIDDANFTYN